LNNQTLFIIAIILNGLDANLIKKNAMEGEHFSELKILVNNEKLSFLFLHKVPFFLFVFICRVENFEISVAVRMCPLVLTHSFVAVAVACCIRRKTGERWLRPRMPKVDFEIQTTKLNVKRIHIQIGKNKRHSFLLTKFKR
jgi:hypothetical protein